MCQKSDGLSAGYYPFEERPAVEATDEFQRDDGGIAGFSGTLAQA
jgi:hypothetical protein